MMGDGDVAALFQVLTYGLVVLAFGLGIIGGQQR